MRFISKNQKLQVKIRPHIEVVQATGARHILQSGLMAQFMPGDVTEWEVEQAYKTFKFNGMPTEEDEVTAIDPLYRLSSFDTATIHDPEERELYEQVLKGSFANGVDYIYVERPELAPPFPAYDSFKGATAELVKKLQADGHSLHSVLEYEQSHQNRSDVIFAIEQGILDAKAVEEEEDTVVA